MLDSQDSNPHFAEISYGGNALLIEHAWIEPLNRGPLIIFLHEGLGSLKMWRTFPQVLCKLTGYRGLVYSRCGYGASSPLWPDKNWPVDFMHVEAREILPRLLTSLGVGPSKQPPILFGHSDGASIALIYASTYPPRVSAVIALAPHLFVESITVSSIERTSAAFIDSDLATKLGKYHAEVQRVFWGWVSVWLNQKFRNWDIRSLCNSLACPTLAVQGLEDQYGTMKQIEDLQRAARQVRLLALKDCGHSPHIDKPEAVIAAVIDLLKCTNMALPPNEV